jgi:hypothetical protein
MKKNLIIILICLIYLFTSCTKTTTATFGWKEIGSLNANGAIKLMKFDANNNLYVTGDFKDAKGYYYIAKWNGTGWIELGGLNANGHINDVAFDPDGNIYAGGAFRDSVGRPYVAKWNGSSWTEFYSQYDGEIYGLSINATGNIFKATEFYVSKEYMSVGRWNGAAFMEVKGGNSLTSISSDILFDSYGNLYAIGSLSGTSLKNICEWNGTTWVPINSGSNAPSLDNPIFAISETNDLYAPYAETGRTGIYDITKWDGTSWNIVGSSKSLSLNANNKILALAIDNSKNVYAAGAFRNSNSYRYVAKWNGLGWSEVGNSIMALRANNDINCLAVDASGNIYAAGTFTDKNGYAYVAEYLQ